MGVRGRRGDKSEHKWSEGEIQGYISSHLLSENTKKYEMYNLFVYDWESDYLAITKSGYIYECEIKISRNDFFNDRKKEHKHLILEGKEFDKRPNYFYYVVPYGLINEGEVPPYAGLAYVNDELKGDRCWRWAIAKKAPMIHNDKYEAQDPLGLTEKFYWNMVSNRNKALQYNKLLSEKNKLEKQLFELDDIISKRTSEISELKNKIVLLENDK